MRLAKKIGPGVYQGDDPDQLFTRQDGDADRRLGPGAVFGVVRAAQPAVIFTGIGDQGRLAVTRNPAGHALLVGHPQLQGGLVMGLPVHQESRFPWLAMFVDGDDAAAGCTDVLHR